MNWKNFQEMGYNLTEAEIKALYPGIVRSYQRARKDIAESIKEQYLKYLDSIDTDKYYNEMLKYDRLLALERQIAIDYIKASKEAEKLTVLATQIGFSNNYYRSVYAAQWLAPEYALTVLPPALIELATIGTTDAWKKYTAKIIKDFGKPNYYGPQLGTLSDLLAKRRKAELSSIMETLTQGLRRGDSYTTMSKSVSDVIGYSVTKDGVKGFTGAMANAMRIVTTESGRVMNDAAFASLKNLEAQGSNVKKMWISVKDGVTRATHGLLDGIIKAVDAYFIIGNDRALKPLSFAKVGNNARCRCTIGAIINDNPPKIMRGRNPNPASPNFGENELLDYKPFSGWAKDVGLKMDKVGVIVG